MPYWDLDSGVKLNPFAFREYYLESNLDLIDLIPHGLTSVSFGRRVTPVAWRHFGSIIDLALVAGLMGFTVENETGTITPLLGWYVGRGDLPDVQSNAHDEL